MASEYINIYMNNPTVGETDGTVVSTDGTQLNPLTVTLDATQNESKKIKLAVRTESGYAATDGATISDYNDTNDRWKFSLTENGTYSDTIIIASSISSVNTIFYGQATSSSLENPSRDTSVQIKTTAVISAV